MQINENGLVEQTHTRKTEFLFTQAKPSVFGNAFTAGLVGVVYWQKLNFELLMAWLFAVSIVLLLRWKLAVHFEQRNRYSSTTDWYRAYNRNVLCNGIVWGAMFLYTCIELNTQSLTGFVAILGALVASSNIAYNSHLKTYLTFVIPALLPALLYLVLFGYSDKLVLTAIASSWFVLMYSFAKQLNEHVGLTSGYEAENVELLRELESLHGISMRLQEEIALKSKIIDLLTTDSQRTAFH
ncbi:MAG: hypothetical protein AB8B48_06425 [Pseudomonadales bacterium]